MALVARNRTNEAENTTHLPGKGRYKDGTRFLHNPNSKQTIADFYVDYPVTLAHILSRTTSLMTKQEQCHP